MVRATVKVKDGVDLDRAVQILSGQGAKVFTTSARTNTVSIEIADEQFFNTFGLYPMLGFRPVKGSYSADFEGVEIAPKPTHF